MIDSMMRKTTNFELVREFNKIMDQDVDTKLDRESINLVWFRLKLIKEEFEEVQDSIFQLNESFLTNHNVDGAKSNLLKELADLLYVVYGAGVSLGLDLDEAFKRVHESNMSKLVDGKPLKNKDGKVIKGPFYKKPFLQDLV